MEILFALGLTAAIIALAGRLPDARRVKRELAVASRQGFATASSLQENTTAVLRGRVTLVDEGAVIRAPATGRECVYALVTFDEVGTGGDYVELGRVEQGRPFLLATAGGAARIVPERPRIALPGDVVAQTWFSAVEALGAEPVLQLARRACRRPNYPATSTLRITEYILRPGMEVTIKGFCTREPDPAAPADVTGYRTELPTRPVISGTRRVPLVIG